MAKRLYKERSTSNDYLRVVADFLETLTLFFAHEMKASRFSYPFAAAMTQLFNHEASIHKFHYAIADEQLEKLRSVETWRKDLSINDMIDVYVRGEERQKPVCGYLQAQITALVGDDDLYIEFPLSSNEYDQRISRWSSNLAPFESKTKEDYEWRRDLVANLDAEKGLECDVNDKTQWNKSTIFEVKKKTITQTRVIDLAHCCLRIYRPHNNQQRSDERGTFEGWSQKFDEWMPIYSPRIQPFLTRTNGNSEEIEVEVELDDLIAPDERFKVIYAVPRPTVCTSSCYLNLVNAFGNTGAFELIMNLISDPEAEKKYENINIEVIGCLAQILTMPFAVYHKNFISSFGNQIVEAIKNRLIITSDTALRDVRKEKVDLIIKAVENISRRFLAKEEREKNSEILRL
jgi:hypothetical protein